MEGLSLATNTDYTISVVVNGTVQPHPFKVEEGITPESDYSYNVDTERQDLDKLDLIFYPRYLSKVGTGDFLTVTVYVQERPQGSTFVQALQVAKDTAALIQQKLDIIRAMPRAWDESQAFSAGAVQATTQQAQPNAIKRSEDRASAIKGLLTIIAGRRDGFRNLQKQFIKERDKTLHDNSKNELLKGRFEAQADALQALDDAFKDMEDKTKERLEHAEAFAELLKSPKDQKKADRYLKAAEAKETGVKVNELVVVENGQLVLQGKLLDYVHARQTDQVRDQKGALLSLAAKAEGMRSIADVVLPLNKNQSRRVASVASRRFTMYEEADFRRLYQKSRVKPNDISVFPLPQSEAEALFGPRVARSYFVVRLSLRNSEETEKLVNTGMIRATGRAIVETSEREEKQRIRFSVPIEVTPHSKEQIYTVLDDSRVDEPRAIVFRGLEFAGAIASAYVVAFEPSTEILQSINLATGVGIPAFGKFWPDRMPGYLRNIVNYAMNDLVKLPKNAVTSHRFLFFPKSKIEAIIIDQNSYAELMREEPLREVFRPIIDRFVNPGFEQPNTYIAYLTFDNLDIPFENVSEAAEGTFAEQAIIYTTKAEKQIDVRENLRTTWTTAGAAKTSPVTNMSGLMLPKIKSAVTMLDAINAKITEVNALFTGKDDEETKKLRDSVSAALKNLRAIAAAIQPIDPGQSGADAPEYYRVLMDHEEFGVEKLRQVKSDLTTISGALARGENPSRYQDAINKDKLTSETAERILTLYQRAADLLRLQESKGFLTQLNTALATPAETQGAAAGPKPKTTAELQASLQALNNSLQELGKLRGTDLRQTVLPEADLLQPEAK